MTFAVRIAAALLGALLLCASLSHGQNVSGAGPSYTTICTNGIRNNSNQGPPVAGTPGTPPNNWQMTSGLSVAVAIVGFGTDAQGIDYIDIKISGTPSGTGTANIYFETTTGIAALTGQTWTESLFLSLVDTTAIPANAISIGYDERTSGGIFVTQAGASLSNAAIPNGPLTRKSFSGILNGGATTAFARPLTYMNFTNGIAVNYTVRVGSPQFQTGSSATLPVIRTINAAVSAFCR